MSNNTDCDLCHGNKVIDVVDTWKETSIWCPRCEPVRYKEACERYLNETGVDISIDPPKVSKERGK